MRILKGAMLFIATMVGALMLQNHSMVAEAAAYAVDMSNLPAQQQTEAKAAMAIWTNTLQMPTLFSGAATDPEAVNITMMWSTDGEASPGANDPLGLTETTTLGDKRTVVITLYQREIDRAFAKTAYMKRHDLVVSVWEHELGHALGLQHNTADDHDIMYPRNLGPTQRITGWDLQNLPLTVKPSVVADVSNHSSNWLDSQNVSNQMSAWLAIPAKVPGIFYHLIVGLLAMVTVAIVATVLLTRRSVVNAEQRAKKFASLK
jgi:predicted Zn-dependent protease